MPRKILLIDDDKAIGLMLEDWFAPPDWDFTCAETGAEALREAARVRPDAIILDVALPDMQGWELCRALRALPACAKTPILLCSGQHRESADAVRGLEAGADDFLPKPLRPALLREKILAMLRSGPTPI